MVPSTFSESFNSSILTVAAQRLKFLYLYCQIIHRPQHRFIVPRAELLWSVGVGLAAFQTVKAVAVDILNDLSLTLTCSRFAGNARYP